MKGINSSANLNGWDGVEMVTFQHTVLFAVQILEIGSELKVVVVGIIKKNI